ncbi:peptidoglycan-binding protein [Streptacidiphilus rugosus]|uniref:peptidoglycan-binding protein n=1 Tax=Streptacidiphilus rugosus TaxID=405783 RepID=UPI00055B5F2D|nr:peptidoglycan-binding protein [Streptacidiphilus rugosus]
MRSNAFTRTLVGLATVAAVAGGGLASAGTALAAPRPAVAPQLVHPMTVANLGLTVDQAKRVQHWLQEFWGYNDGIDGQLGTNSWKAMQRSLQQFWGYTGQIDGIVGSGTVSALQRMLKDGGWGYSGAIDGIAGPGTTAAFAAFAAGEGGPA